MNGPVTITLRQEELQDWLRGANNALRPKVDFQDDAELVRQEADSIRRGFLEVLIARLNDILQ